MACVAGVCGVKQCITTGEGDPRMSFGNRWPSRRLRCVAYSSPEHGRAVMRAEFTGVPDSDGIQGSTAGGERAIDKRHVGEPTFIMDVRCTRAKDGSRAVANKKDKKRRLREMPRSVEGSQASWSGWLRLERKRVLQKRSLRVMRV